MSEEPGDFELGGFAKAAATTARGVAMTGAAGAGAGVGISMGNSIIAAGLGAACSPFALVIPLAGAAAWGVYKAFKWIGLD